MIEKIFNCTRCGFCCHGETTVSLDEQDVANMQKCLALSREELIERYLRVTSGQIQMKIVDGHCIFYDKNIGCKVHLGRPWRCRQWPLHPALLKDGSNFSIIAESCPGLQNDMQYEEFSHLLKEILVQKEADGGWKVKL